MLDNWPDPLQVKDIAGFVAALRRLRTGTGLSFRELERQAGRNGDQLPSSTVSAALSRDRLPRPDLVGAFVRACGGDEPTVEAWLAARASLAAGGTDDVPETPRRRRFGAREYLVAAAVVVVAAVVAALLLTTDRQDPVAGPATPARTTVLAARVPPSGEAITLAHTGLCVGEGPERKPGATRVVLGQYDCATATPPISLQLVAPGVYRLILHSVDKGPGCVTVDNGGTVVETLLSGAACEEGRPDQEFTFEPVETPVAGHRMHSVAAENWCIGAYEGSDRPGTQLIQVPCDGGAHQVFVVPL